MTSKREPSDINVPAGPELVLEAPLNICDICMAPL